MEAIEKLLGRLPILALIIAYSSYLGYEYWDWMQSDSSELGQKKAAVMNAHQNLEMVKKKLETAQEFYKNLDTIRLRVRQLTGQLDQTKEALTSEVDVAKFIKMITMEAKKLRLTIKAIKPAAEVKKDYYIEVPFNVELKGAYVQQMVFFDRISKLRQLIRVSDFIMKPTPNIATKYVELDGNVQLVAFKYLGTTADDIANKTKEEADKSEKMEDPKKSAKEKGAST
ncbi:MAG: type 4a pilus biogenesis protein PilO [Bacteriovoracia bacterium]